MRCWVIVGAILLALGTAWSRTQDDPPVVDDASPADEPGDAKASDDATVVIEGADHPDAEPSDAVAAAAPRARDRRIEVGAFIGSQLVYPRMPTRSRSGLSFGARGGYRIARWLVVEAELGFAPTKADADDVLIMAWRVHGLLQLPPDGLLDGDLRPFFVAGTGGITSSYASTRRDGQELQVPFTESDTDLVIDAGIGVAYTGLGAIGLRLDIRAVMAPLGEDRFDTPDLELLFGVYGRFGGTPARPAQPVTAGDGVGDSDGDGDGVIGASDRCPAEAEDLDSVEDTDGCPDPDNDGDLILDVDDRCPLEAEDANGIDDDDGCHEVDEDRDTVLGSADVCPTQAEDIDGFADHDGCPDPDNDGDGVLDDADTCPAELEVLNGFEDADGCPDKVPPEVLSIVGVLKGLTFDRTDALALRGRPPRSKPLDELAAILARFPSLEIEISAHGHGKGGPEEWLSATTRRAESVKSYLVGRGVDEARVTATGRGLEAPITDKRGTRTTERVEVSVVGLSPVGR